MSATGGCTCHHHLLRASCCRHSLSLGRSSKAHCSVFDSESGPRRITSASSTYPTTDSRHHCRWCWRERTTWCCRRRWRQSEETAAKSARSTTSNLNSKIEKTTRQCFDWYCCNICCLLVSARSIHNLQCVWIKRPNSYNTVCFTARSRTFSIKCSSVLVAEQTRANCRLCCVAHSSIEGTWREALIDERGRAGRVPPSSCPPGALPAPSPL